MSMEELDKKLKEIDEDMAGLREITNLLKRQNDLFEFFDKAKEMLSEDAEKCKSEPGDSGSPQKSDSVYDAAKEQVKSIVGTYGIEIYNDKTRLNALIADYITFDTPVRKILSYAVRENIPSKLLAIKDLNQNEKNIELSKMKHNYHQDNGIREEVAGFVVDCFMEALSSVKE